MGLLGLKLLMSMQRVQKRLQEAPPNRSIASQKAKRKRSPCHQHDESQGSKRMEYSGPELPEDIWGHIHSLLPMRDAARVACVSSAFLRFWNCHPNLIFDNNALGLNENARPKGAAAKHIASKALGLEFSERVDRILEKHSGTGVKTFKLAFYDHVVDACRLNNWLQTAGKLRVEELSFSAGSDYRQDPYNFPCSVLVDEYGNSMIRHLFLGSCAFRPTTGLANLTALDLCSVHITGDELGSLVSNSSSLERLALRHCSEITYLTIPHQLQHLSCLKVFECRKLRMLRSKAPNLSNFHFTGAQIQLSFGDRVPVKNMRMWFFQCNTVYYARAKLPSIVPNVETLNIYSISEVVSTPILPIKFLHLKNLTISLEEGDGPFSPAYDYLSMVSFLDACPVLEAFELTVSQTRMKHDSVIGDSSHLRQMPEYCHHNIKNVKIIGFCSAKSMVELACHILENATSLESLTLDTIYNDDYFDRHVPKIGECIPKHRRHMIKEARKALLAIERCRKIITE
uniref:Uncharacterized protein n=1 Tax=Avena sativa TaxID=4498 RepID=A0ACD5ZEL5_AVESA